MTTDQPAKLKAACDALKLTMEWKFVPFSQSRNADEKSFSLNWKGKLMRDGRVIIDNIDYMQGIAHAPTYKLSVKEAGGRNSLMREEMFKYEVETGRCYVKPYTGVTSKPIASPSIDEVMYSLVSESSALDHANYESWASDYGFDEDSRKGEAIYRDCLSQSLALRAGIGDVGLKVLQAASQDY